VNKPSEAVVIVDPVSSGELLLAPARAQGLRVVGVFTLPETERSHFGHVVSKCDIAMFGHELVPVLAELRKLPEVIRGVIAGSEPGVALADQLAEALRLPGNSTRTTDARRNKLRMRELAKQSGLSVPDFARCSSRRELAAFAQTHLFPLVIKPPEAAGAFGVAICNSLEELYAALDLIQSTPDVFGQRSPYAVVEEYLSGTEYFADVFSDGQTVHVVYACEFTKIQVQPTRSVLYDLISVPLSDARAQPVFDYACRAARALGVALGAAHVEVKDDPRRGPTLIELGSRWAGLQIPAHVQSFTNFDFQQKTIEVFVDGTTTLPDVIHSAKHFAFAFNPLLAGGQVAHIHGLEEIERLPSFSRHVLHLHTGDYVDPSADLGSIPSIVFLAHEDREQLLVDVKEAHRLFAVEFESAVAQAGAGR
jgi:biotin carboxylase